MIKRHYTADSLNPVVNDPSVFEWVRGNAKGPLDLTPLIKDTNNVLLMSEYGGVLFIFHQPGLYEAHVQVLPKGRGKWTLNMVQEALHYMFTRTNAVEITTRVPRGNFAARALTKAIHGVYQFTMEYGWVRNEQSIPADIFSLTVQEWMKAAPRLVESGKKFLGRVKDEYARHGVNLQVQVGDTEYRYTGAAADMIFGGLPQKGVVFFNRWAAITGHPKISIMTENPLVIDVQGALLRIKDNDFWVMACR